MTGKVVASGRAAEIMPNGGFAAIAGQGEMEIPSDFWHPSDIDWNADYQWRRTKPRPDVYSYVDVAIHVADLKRAFPVPRQAVTAEASRPGRPRKYDEYDILRLCVCEANISGLSEDQADFMRRMIDLIGALRGESAVPGDTRLKEIISEIYSVRGDYERARQAIPGE